MSDANVQTTSLLGITKKSYAEYGRSVIENRALPDYRDGLKPVHRRIIHAMNELSLNPSAPRAKAARVVGDTMGKYHPHGDQSIYDAMVNMANLAEPLVDGDGNWGGLNDPAAAMRYTEARLTKYAHSSMLSKDYLAISPKIPNYDGKEQEPLYLPALLPNLLLNGTYGIAVGVTSIMPPFKLEPLLPLIESYLNGDPITWKGFRRRAQFNWPYGGVCSSDQTSIDHWMKEGHGGISFGPVWSMDADTRTVIFTKVPPYFNWELVVKRLSTMANISGYDDLISKNDRKGNIRSTRFVVKFKNNVPREDLDLAMEPVVAAFSTSVRMATHYTLRHDEETVEFRGSNLANLLEAWIDYRIDLEKRVQQYRTGILDGKISYQQLLKLAVDNKAIILKSLDSDSPDGFLIDRLKITKDQADTILSLQVRSLSRLNGDKIVQEIDDLQRERKQTIRHFKNPNPKVMTDLSDGLKLLAA